MTGPLIYFIYAWLFVGGLYFWYRHYASSRIICFIFNDQRRLYRKAVKPDKFGALHINGKAYHYKEEFIFYTPGMLLREPSPALVFHEDKPDPVNLALEKPESVYSAAEYSEILNDSTVTDFVRAQAGISPKQIITAISIAAILSIGVSVLSSFLIMQQINPEFLQGLVE